MIRVSHNIAKMILITHCIVMVMQLSPAEAFVNSASSKTAISRNELSLVPSQGSATRIMHEARQAQHMALKSARVVSHLKSSASSDDSDSNETMDETLVVEISNTTDGSSHHNSESPFFAVMDTGDGSSPAPTTAQFGDVVKLGSGSQHKDMGMDSAFFAPPAPIASNKPVSLEISAAEEKAKNRKKQNFFVAVASVGLALVNYLYQFTHPLSSLQLLSTMQHDHAPETTLHLLGNNGKPTMVDFWAPWCENCKQMAPTLYQIQQQYGKDVNFVMVNGDDPAAWPLIEAFGVDAIPHMALVEADGTVDTALIGPVPKAWLDADLQALIGNSRQMNSKAKSDDETTATRTKLPYQMLDVFANRPEERRLQVTLKQ